MKGRRHGASVRDDVCGRALDTALPSLRPAPGHCLPVRPALGPWAGGRRWRPRAPPRRLSPSGPRQAAPAAGGARPTPPPPPGRPARYASMKNPAIAFAADQASMRNHSSRRGRIESSTRETQTPSRCLLICHQGLPIPLPAALRLKQQGSRAGDFAFQAAI